MLMKARTAKDIHMGIIALLYNNASTEKLIGDVKSGEQKVLQIRNVLTTYLEGNKYKLVDSVGSSIFRGKEIEEVTPEQVKERAHRVLEEIKDVKSEKGKEGGITPKIEELVAEFKAGKFEPLFNYIETKSKHTKTKRKKILIKFKDELLSIAKKIKDEELRISTIKRLEAIDWEFKEGTKQYKLTGTPSHQKIYEYYMLIFGPSKLTPKNRRKMLPNVGKSLIFGPKKNTLYPALEYILATPTFTLDEELEKVFRIPKTKLSLATAMAIRNIKEQEELPKLTGFNLFKLLEKMNEVENNTSKFMKAVKEDKQLREAFNAYNEYLQIQLGKPKTREIPRKDYDALNLHESDIVAEAYGFDDYDDWEDWISEPERKQAWKEMEEHEDVMRVKTKRFRRDIGLLSNMFTSRDLNIAQTIVGAATTERRLELNDNIFNKSVVVSEDVVEMLTKLDTKFSKIGFNVLVDDILVSKDESEIKEIVDDILDKLEKGDYKKIRQGFLDATIEKMEDIASKSIRLAEDEHEDSTGQIEPLDILRELGLLGATKI